MELRPEVQWFAEQMERVLRENDYKGGWHEMTTRELWERVHDECLELRNAVGPVRGSSYIHVDHILKESVDIANFAMMMADRVREYV